jgi:hypothetical protein
LIRRQLFATFRVKKGHVVNLPGHSEKGGFVMGVLPAIPMCLLLLVAVWFFWPLVVDPIVRAMNTSRRDLRREADRTADYLFDAWTERG